jgi:regulator of protease activity HflC (stomatin/prohibitin superfamily)
VSGWLQWLVDLLWGAVLAFILKQPGVVLVALVAIARACGTTVQTGWKGVLFVLGRARRELEPGLHWLIPLVHTVRHTHVRSVTLELPRQRITTADGLVYGVTVDLVYHVADPAKSMIEIADVRKGIEAVVPLIVQEVLRGQDRAALLERRTLDEDLAARAGQQLARWGVEVEQAGFTDIAPTHETLRLTQLALLAAERRRVVGELLRAGLGPRAALALLGADRRLVAHSTARYRAARRRAARRRPVAREKIAAADKAAPVKEGEAGEAASPDGIVGQEAKS